MDLSNSFHPVYAIVSFFGGWCGTVPISVIIWWLIHHGKTGPPPPDPWWKISIAGAFAGLVLGTLVNAALIDVTTINSTAVLQSTLTGIIAGTIAGSFAAKDALAGLGK